jgi:glutamate racemase
VCNTATFTTAAALRARHALPIVGVEPAIKPATEMSAAVESSS